MYQKELTKRVATAEQTLTMAKDWHARGLPWDEAVRRASVVHRGVYNASVDSAMAKRVVDAIDNKVKLDYAMEGFGERALAVTLENKVQKLKQMDLVKKHTAKIWEDAVAAGPEGIADVIAKGEARAKFWAKDQTGSILHKFQLARANQTGSRRFIWVRTRSRNPREEHTAKVGQEFTYDYGGELPGELYNCKCGMKPIY